MLGGWCLPVAGCDNSCVCLLALGCALPLQKMGGATAEIMCDLLAFEADRRAVSITLNRSYARPSSAMLGMSAGHSLIKGPWLLCWCGRHARCGVTNLLGACRFLL